MKLIWHQFRKDLRALRWVIAAWLGVLSLGVLSMTVTSSWGGAAGGFVFALIDYLVDLLEAMAVLVMVPLLVHQEPLVGTTAAWLTRPLSRAQLLASKLLFAVGVILVPGLLAEAAALAANRIPADRIALAAIEGGFFRCALVFPVAALAALTPGFARFAAWVAGAWMLQATVGGALVFAQLLGGNPLAMIENLSVWEARQVVGSAVLILTGAAVAVHQYLTRRTRISTGLAAAGLVLVVGAQGCWPWRIHASVEPRVANGPDTGGFEVELAPDSLRARDVFSFSFFGASGPRRKQLSGDLTCSPLPPGSFCQLDELRGELRFEDGSVVPIEKGGDLDGLNLIRVDAEAASATLDAAVAGGRISLGGHTELFELDRDRFELHGERPATLEATATVRLRRYRVATELPLTPGVRADRGSEQLRLVDVLDAPRSRSLLLVRTRLRLRLFDPTPQPILEQFLDPTVYALVNRSRGQALLHDYEPGFDPTVALASGRRLRKSVLSRRFGSEDWHGRAHFEDLDRAWFEQSRLVLLEVEELGVRRSTLLTEGVVLDRRRP